MPDGLLPLTLDGAADVTDPQVVVEAFLAAMAAGDARAASDLVDEDILYVNVGYPPIRGRRGVDKVLNLLERPGNGFEVYLHAISAEGDVVLTERTDVLVVGPLRVQFWVWGRFDVRDGKIALWRDSFDNLDILRGFVRGLLGIFVPSLQPAPPVPGSAPGR